MTDVPKDKQVNPLRRLRRTLRLHLYRALDKRELTLSGVRTGCAAEEIPKSVRSSLFKGTYEEFERELVEKVVRPGDHVLEIGTGIGLVSLLATRLAGVGNVLSYEANPALEPIITANYRRNGWEPNLRMKAVTVEGGPLTFYQSDNIVSSSSVDRQLNQRQMTVQSDPIGAVIAEHEPSILVMDVEGAEIDLLTRADLSGVRAIIVETHPHIVGAEKTDAMIAHLNAGGLETRERRHKTYLFARAG